MDSEDAAAQGMAQQPLYTCLSCSIAFLTAEEQRIHYRSDHHRYNMKRRVASLPPVSAAVFNQKVVERRQQTAVMSLAKGSSCAICNKTYTTENAHRSHINSKKHKDNELKIASRQPEDSKKDSEPKAASIQPARAATGLTVDGDASEDEINRTIDEKIAAARSRNSLTQCLFCPEAPSSLEDNLTHMSTDHSFFIPDADYLVNLPGLLNYLGEKIVVGNICIFCNGKGREFRTLYAVRKHMLDKSHCKIAYDNENDKLEISDFYDFSSSYPDASQRVRKTKLPPKNDGEVDADGWEDVEDDDGDTVDEVLDEEVSDEEKSQDKSDLDSLPDNDITYGDSHLELVLPSGARIGHRSMRRFYAQSLPRGSRPEDPKSGAALVRRLLADKNSALIPSGGGFGAFGRGTQVVKAKNKGEAREAGRHIREFRDQKRREDFKTKVGFISNHQKHFRDPLLQ